MGNKMSKEVQIIEDARGRPVSELVYNSITCIKCEEYLGSYDDPFAPIFCKKCFPELFEEHPQFKKYKQKEK